MHTLPRWEASFPDSKCRRGRRRARWSRYPHLSPAGVDRTLSDGVSRQLGHERRIHAVVGKRHGHIGLAAAEGRLQLIVLEKAVVPVGASRSMISPNVTIRLLIVRSSSLPQQMNGKSAKITVDVDGCRVALGIRFTSLGQTPDTG